MLRVLPELRRYGATRGLDIQFVDLRWGVTEAEIADGRLIERCLGVVDECRPFFIGILGERYGTTITRIPDALRARQPWLEEFEGRSLTELEIEYGVIRRIETTHAYFYFRAQTGESVSGENQDEISRARLLKRRICETKATIYDGYTTTEEFCKAISSHLTGLIDKISAPREGLPGAKHHWRFFDAVSGAAVRLTMREAQIERSLEGGITRLALLGPSGCGKTFLLAGWLREVGRRHGHRTISYWETAAKGENWTYAAAVLAIQCVGEEMIANPSFNSLDRMLDKALDRVSTDEIATLVLDGLDEVIGDMGYLGWLPTRAMSHARFIVSTRDNDVAERLALLGWKVLQIAPLEPSERAEFIDRYLAERGKRPDSSLRQALVAHPAGGQPPFLAAAIEEIAIWGTHVTLPSEVARLRRTNSASDVVASSLDRQGASREIVVQSLAVLACSPRGVSESTLARVVVNLVGEPKSSWPQWRTMLTRYVLQVGDGRLILLDPVTIHDALGQLLDPDWKRRVRAILLDELRSQELSFHNALDLVHQLSALNRWDEAADVLSTESVAKFLNGNRWANLWLPLIQNGVKVQTHLSPLIRSTEPAIVQKAAELLGWTGDREGAANCFRHASALYALAHDDRGAVTCLTQEAVALQSSSPQLALKLHAEACERLLQLGDRSGACHAMVRQVDCLRRLFRFEEALSLSERIIALAAELQEPVLLGKGWGTKAAALVKMGRLQEALAAHEQEERFDRAGGDAASLGASLLNQSITLRLVADFTGAVRALERSCKAYEFAGDLAGLQRAQQELAFAQVDAKFLNSMESRKENS